MKILYRSSPFGAGFYIGAGICNAFKQLGHEVLVSSDIGQSIFDEFNPDLFFGSISYINDFDYVGDTAVLSWTFPHTLMDTTKDMLMTKVTQEQVKRYISEQPEMAVAGCNLNTKHEVSGNSSQA